MLHSLLEGVYGPSWSYIHSVFPVGSVVPHVEAPFVDCSSSLHNLVLVEHWSFLTCLLCSYPSGAYTPMKTSQNTVRNENQDTKKVNVS